MPPSNWRRKASSRSKAHDWSTAHAPPYFRDLPESPPDPSDNLSMLPEMTPSEIEPDYSEREVPDRDKRYRAVPNGKIVAIDS